jgi:S-DNA-T family DNA segregation ATPase FtsK/SpoIIIE
VYDPVAVESVQEPSVDEQERDETYERARELVMTTGQASASFIQRRLRVGYPRAARMIEQMEEEGLVSAPGRDGRRDVLARGTAIAEIG